VYNNIIKKYLDIDNMYTDAYVLEKKEPTLRKGQLLVPSFLDIS